MKSSNGMDRRSFIKKTATYTLGALTVSYFAPLNLHAKKKVSLAFVPKALNNPVFEITRAGAEDRVAELSDVTFRWVGPRLNDRCRRPVADYR